MSGLYEGGWTFVGAFLLVVFLQVVLVPKSLEN
jgi:hypothetical protein